MKTALTTLALLAAGCHCGAQDSAAPGGSGALLWPGEDLRPELDHPFFQELDLQRQDLSLYATYVVGDAEERPDHQHRGAFAVGNGLVFSLLGLADPVNTLHGLVGPVYEKESRFFGDLAVLLEQDGQQADFQREWVARLRGSAVVLTRAETDAAALYTVDFAPHPAAADEPPPALVRIMLVQVLDSSAHELRLRLQPYRQPEQVDGFLVEDIESDGRSMAYLAWEGELKQDAEGWNFDLGQLAAGESAQLALVLAMGRSSEQLQAVSQQLEESSAQAWLQDTLAWWQDYSAQGVQLATEDERIEDLFDGMRAGIKVQQSAAGAICPMSEYTQVWLRDSIGPVRFLLRAGLHDEARSALDYLHLCASVEGDYSNACASGLSEDDLKQEPDWSSMGSFSGRLAAEGPSYVPLAYGAYADFTGDWEPVQERWEYISRALLAQQIDEEGRQPFSGDETFRVAMSAALGYDLDLLYEEECWSANSSFLMAAAAQWMAEAAPQVGREDEVQDWNALAALARNALDEHFWLDEGLYAPFIFHVSGELAQQPFEDVNLKPLWLDPLAADDSAALSNLAALRAAAGRGDGRVQTPLAVSYDALGVEEGVCTGMVPGFYLANLRAVGDPEAALAFDALHAYADSAGQYGEYMVYDDLSALQPIYDPTGTIGDYTARHRPWEGGINLDAFLLYLAGPLTGQGEGTLALAPHLPNGLPWLELAHLRAAGAAGTLKTWQWDQGLGVDFLSEAESSFSVQLDLPLPADFGEVLSSSVDGAAAGEELTLPGGERIVRFEALELAAGEELNFYVARH